jgi:hypothetical protein
MAETEHSAGPTRQRRGRYRDPEKRRAKGRRSYQRHREKIKAAVLARRVARRADPLKAEHDRLWRLEHKRKLRRAAGAKLREYIAASTFERQQSRLAGLNARQAWRWWVCERASALWLDQYWRDHPEPWRDSRLTHAERWSLRYSVDQRFRRLQRQRASLRRHANAGRSARWERNGTRWRRAAESEDGTLTLEILGALEAETHCAYCLRPLSDQKYQRHLDHGMAATFRRRT